MLRGTSATLLAEFLVALPGALRHMDACEEPSVTETVRTTLSACLAGCIKPGPLATDDAQVRLRLGVDKIIAENLSSSRLTPARIAEIAGVSRSTLYRAFEMDGGIAQHLLRRRLALVRRDLETPSLVTLSVSQIAERRGLHNAASFHRVFRHHVGETPGEYRANSQAGRVRPTQTRQSKAGEHVRHFIDLLRSV